MTICRREAKTLKLGKEYRENQGKGEFTEQ